MHWIRNSVINCNIHITTAGMSISNSTNSHHTTTSTATERQDKPFLIALLYIAVILTLKAALLTYYLYHECKYGKIIAERILKNEFADVEKNSVDKLSLCDEAGIDTFNQTLQIFGVNNDNDKEDFWNSSKCNSSNSIHTNSSDGDQKTTENAKKIKTLVNHDKSPG